MFVQMRKWVVTEGNSDKVIERFTRRKNPDKPSLLESREGYIGREILVKKVRRGEEEVMMMVRWESEEAWKAWEKSPEHIAGHKAKIAAGNPKPELPDYVISTDRGLYYTVD